MAGLRRRVNRMGTSRFSLIICCQSSISPTFPCASAERAFE